jgi:hypothetical protein
MSKSTHTLSRAPIDKTRLMGSVSPFRWLEKAFFILTLISWLQFAEEVLGKRDFTQRSFGFLQADLEGVGGS